MKNSWSHVWWNKAQRSHSEKQVSSNVFITYLLDWGGQDSSALTLRCRCCRDYSRHFVVVSSASHLRLLSSPVRWISSLALIDAHAAYPDCSYCSSLGFVETNCSNCCSLCVWNFVLMSHAVVQKRNRSHSNERALPQTHCDYRWCWCSCCCWVAYCHCNWNGSRDLLRHSAEIASICVAVSANCLFAVVEYATPFVFAPFLWVLSVLALCCVQCR